MRVVAGGLGGRTLKSPPALEGRGRPPTAARETLFSILGDVSDLSVLDLFCGTGALAIEAISRGADSAVLVDERARRSPSATPRSSGSPTAASSCASDAIRYLRAHRGALRARLLRPAI